MKKGASWTYDTPSFWMFVVMCLVLSDSSDKT